MHARCSYSEARGRQFQGKAMLAFFVFCMIGRRGASDDTFDDDTPLPTALPSTSPPSLPEDSSLSTPAPTLSIMAPAAGTVQWKDGQASTPATATDSSLLTPSPTLSLMAPTLASESTPSTPKPPPSEDLAEEATALRTPIPTPAPPMPPRSPAPTPPEETLLAPAPQKAEGCPKGQLQLDPISLGCSGGTGSKKLWLMPKGTPQAVFHWRAPAGTTDLEATAVMVGQPSSANGVYSVANVTSAGVGVALVVRCLSSSSMDDNKSFNPLLISSEGGLLDSTTHARDIGDAHWSWSGDPLYADNHGLYVDGFKVRGKLECDAEIALQNMNVLPVMAQLRYSWAGIEPCPPALPGCIACPIDVCHLDEQAYCDGSAYWKCVEMPFASQPLAPLTGDAIHIGSDTEAAPAVSALVPSPKPVLVQASTTPTLTPRPTPAPTRAPTLTEKAEDLGASATNVSFANTNAAGVAGLLLASTTLKAMPTTARATLSTSTLAPKTTTEALEIPVPTATANGAEKLGSTTSEREPRDAANATLAAAAGAAGFATTAEPPRNHHGQHAATGAATVTAAAAAVTSAAKKGPQVDDEEESTSTMIAPEGTSTTAEGGVPPAPSFASTLKTLVVGILACASAICIGGILGAVALHFGTDFGSPKAEPAQRQAASLGEQTFDREPLRGAATTGSRSDERGLYEPLNRSPRGPTRDASDDTNP